MLVPQIRRSLLMLLPLRRLRPTRREQQRQCSWIERGEFNPAMDLNVVTSFSIYLLRGLCSCTPFYHCTPAFVLLFDPIGVVESLPYNYIPVQSRLFQTVGCLHALSTSSTDPRHAAAQTTHTSAGRAPRCSPHPRRVRARWR